MRFARGVREDLVSSWDGWSGSMRTWPEVPWRRSSLAFMISMHLGLADEVCPSVLERLAR